MSLRIRYLRPDATMESVHVFAEGTTLGEALAVIEAGTATVDPAACGIWGERRTPDSPLRDGDRIERYSTLRVDPKTARRRNVDRSRGGKM